MLGVSARSFRRHVAPVLPSVRIGGSVRYDLRDLEAWVAAQKGGVPNGVEPAARPRARKDTAIVVDELTQRRAREALSKLGLLGKPRSS